MTTQNSSVVINDTIEIINGWWFICRPVSDIKSTQVQASEDKNNHVSYPIPIFTARNSSCGKVMFSQACVCSGGVGMSPVMTTRCHQQGVGMTRMRGLVSQVPWYTHPPVVLTPSGGHQNIQLASGRYRSY